MPQGTIKKVIADKGFGFIGGERGDLFFHHGAVEGTSIEALRVGQSGDLRGRTRPEGPAREKVRLGGLFRNGGPCHAAGHVECAWRRFSSMAHSLTPHRRKECP